MVPCDKGFSHPGVGAGARHPLTRFRRKAKPERSGVSSIRMIKTVAVIPQDDETVR